MHQHSDNVSEKGAELHSAASSSAPSAVGADKSRPKRRRTPSCTACAAAKVRCVGAPPCTRCREKGPVAARNCTPVVWSRRVAAVNVSHQGANMEQQQQQQQHSSVPSSSSYLAHASRKSVSLDTELAPSNNTTTTQPAYASGPMSSSGGNKRSGGSGNSPFGLVVISWDSLPFTGQNSVWVNPRLASWLGYTSDVLSFVFGSYMGLTQAMSEASVIRFLGRLFGALETTSQTFGCPVTLRRCDGQPLLVHCVGLIRYTPGKTLFLQFFLPFNVSTSTASRQGQSTPSANRSAPPASNPGMASSITSPSPTAHFTFETLTTMLDTNSQPPGPVSTPTLSMSSDPLLSGPLESPRQPAQPVAGSNASVNEHSAQGNAGSGDNSELEQLWASMNQQRSDATRQTGVPRWLP